MPAAHDRGGGHARVVDGVLQRHERAVGMPEHGVPVEPQRPGEHDHVLREALERPGLRRRAFRPATGPLIDEHQPHSAFGERVEVVGELVVVETGPAVEHQQRQTLVGAPLHHPE